MFMKQSRLRSLVVSAIVAYGDSRDCTLRYQKHYDVETQSKYSPDALFGPQ